MMYSSPYTISIYVALIVSSTSSEDRYLHRNILPSAEKNSSLPTSRRNDNLKRMLSFIRNSPEFYPFTFSIILPGYQSDVVDYVTKYVSENSINAYMVKVNDLPRKRSWLDRIDVTWLLFIDDIYTLYSLIGWGQKLWKARNQYLILFTNEEHSIIWRRIFEILWGRFDVYKAIVANVREDFRCFMKYLPFDHSGGKFGGIYEVCPRGPHYGVEQRHSRERAPRNASRMHDVSEIPSTRSTELFEKFRDLKDYPMPVIVFDSLMMNISYDNNSEVILSNLDAKIINLLEKTIRIKFKIRVLDGTASEDDPFDRSLRYIENGTAEMIITGFFMKRYSEYHDYEFTSAIYEDKLCFIAPAAGLVSKSYMPFLPFEKGLWALLILYNVAISVLWYCFKYLSKSFRDQNQISLPTESSLNTSHRRDESPIFLPWEERASFAKNRRVLWANFSLGSFHDFRTREHGLVRVTAKRGSNPSSICDPPQIHPDILACFQLIETSCYPLQGARTASQKAFLLGTLFFGLIVTGLYQSCLVSSLSKPFHYPELKTLEDVADSNMSIVTKYANLKRTFVDDTPLGRRLREKIVVTNSSKPTNDLVAYTGRMIALGRYASMKLENLTMYYDDEGNRLLHIVEECPASYMVSYVLRLYSPYRERINLILLRTREAGLVQLWYRDMVYRLEVETKKRDVVKSERRIRLTLEHYSLTFLLLFIGLLGCTLVFFGEMCFAGRLSCQVVGRKM